jgi:hypothetical protein
MLYKIALVLTPTYFSIFCVADVANLIIIIISLTLSLIVSMILGKILGKSE